MSILSALRQQNDSLDDLAKLPQSLIMKMAQQKTIAPEMVAPILSRKSELMDAANRTRALASGQGQPQVPTIMEGLMAKNSASENPPQRMAPQGMPEQGYAGGGIVAFAEGDYVDDDDIEDERDFAEHQQMMAQGRELADFYASRGAGPKSSGKKAPSQEAPKAKVVTKERVTHTVKEPNKKHPYGEMVERDAIKYGNDPKMVHRILNNETGNVKNPETAVSPAGARGIAQFMPATAKHYGIDPFKPEEASRGLNQHVHHLMKKYGDPQLVAIAYNWGEGNTNKWLANGADPSRLPKETQTYLSRFMSNAMAKGGVVGYAKGGKVERATYEQQMEKAFGYKPEIGPMAKHYMSGGHVEHFEVGGTTERRKQADIDRATMMQAPAAAADVLLGGPWNAIASGAESAANAIGIPRLGRALGIYDPDVTSVEVPKIGSGSATPYYDKYVRERIANAGNQKVAPPKEAPKDQKKSEAKPPVQKVEAPSAPKSEKEAPVVAEEKEAKTPPVDYSKSIQSDYDKLIGMMTERYGESRKNREMDKNMAIVAAGLGMMAGDSPYAAVNIGKGALAGLQQYSDAKKTAISDEVNTMKNIGFMMRNKEAGEQNRQVLEARKEYQKEEQEIKRERNRQSRQAAADAHMDRASAQYGLWRKNFMASAEKRANELAGMGDEKGATALLLKAEADLAMHPQTKRLSKISGIDYSSMPNYSGFSIVK